MVQIVLEEANTWDGLLFSGSPYVRFTSRCCHYTQVWLHTEQQVLFSMAPWSVAQMRAGWRRLCCPRARPAASPPGAPEMVLQSETNLQITLSGEAFMQTGKTHSLVTSDNLQRAGFPTILLSSVAKFCIS